MSITKYSLHWPLALLLSVFLNSAALAVEPIYSNFFGSAISGYDPVAYFKEHKAVEGKSAHTYRWNDAKWYFSSAENKADFIAAPEKYAPQYGGYCAWAVTQGAAVKTDPTAWHIEGGKLYLNYDQRIKAQWSEDLVKNIQVADEKWPEILKE